MAKNKMIMALAKVMVAAAWADGAVSNEELNSLKDLMFHLPGMTERDWAELDIYMDTPVQPDERARLVADLRASLSSRQERELAISVLDSMIQADGATSDNERAVLAEIRSSLEHSDVNLIGQMGRLVRGSVGRRSAAAAAAPNRELYLDDFIQNKIYYRLSQHLRQDNLQLDLPDQELRRLSMAGGLMARVAYVDQEVGSEEFDKITMAVEDYFKLSRESAGFVVEVAVDTISKELDYYRLTREFFEATTEDERVRFLKVLFAVAASDGKVSHEEMEEIRTIATVLKLSHEQFIEAKLSIPREQCAY
jgi:uncharacterized tellurite resistance protein B-like protein